MRRFLLGLLIALGPGLILATAAGCGEEIRTQSHSERVQESEPRMVSPGEPIPE